MNIQFDTDGMDLLLLQLKDVLSQTDECYLGLRRLYSELMDDSAMQMVRKPIWHWGIWSGRPPVCICCGTGWRL